MKEWMIIASEFPPLGGSGVQRSAKFVKYLTRKGIRCHVVTRRAVGGVVDPSLEKELPPNMRRMGLPRYLPAEGPALWRRLVHVAARVLLIPDAEVFWFYFNRKRVLASLDTHPVDVLYSSSHPYSGHLLARYLKKKRPDLFWVADFRDEWTNNPYFESAWYRRLRKPLERRMERSVLERCDHMIANTPWMHARFVADVPSLATKSTVIPNGFDPEDFLGYVPKPEAAKKYTLVYSGALYGLRKPDHVLEALGQLIAEKRVDPAKVEIQFIGHFKEKELLERCAHFGLASVARLVGYMPHDELIAHLGRSHLLLLIESDPTFYTGKVFEYIRLGVPILATVPVEGAAASIVRQTKTGQVVPIADIEAIASAIEAGYRRWERGDFGVPEADDGAMMQYSRAMQTEALIQCVKER